ncbi:hypothetical protein B0H10DRAFT_2067949 [Mycena sp. CBHHK59/15]|nr:hypothetical protein B0H10DRAFT_2067949 [Mycena sp. CBHHK59/15]
MTSSTPMCRSDAVAEVQNDPKLDLSPTSKNMVDKAKAVFLDRLKQVDTSNGPVETVESSGTHAHPIISGEEQDKIDRRHKTCAQFTSVVVTPEAKKAYLPLASTHESPPETRKSSAERARPGLQRLPSASATDRLIALPESGKAPTDKTSNHDADSNETESILKIPYSKFDDFCRDALIKVAHEMWELSEVKRSMDGEKPCAAKKANTDSIRGRPEHFRVI